MDFMSGLTADLQRGNAEVKRQNEALRAQAAELVAAYEELEAEAEDKGRRADVLAHAYKDIAAASFAAIRALWVVHTMPVVDPAAGGEGVSAVAAADEAAQAALLTVLQHQERTQRLLLDAGLSDVVHAVAAGEAGGPLLPTLPQHAGGVSRAGDGGGPLAARLQERQLFTSALQELKSYSDGLASDKAALQRQVQQLEASAAAARSDAAKASAEASKAAARAAEAEAVAAAAKAETARIAGQLQVDGEAWTPARIKETAEAAERLGREAGLAALRLEAAGDEARAAQAEVAALRASHVPRSELEAVVSKAALLEGRLAAAEAAEAERVAALAAAEAAAAAAQEACSSAVARADALTTQLSEAQEKLAAAVARGEDVAAQLAAAQASLAELKEAKAAVEKRAAAALKDVQEQVAALTSAVTTIKEAAASPPKPAGGWVWMEGGGAPAARPGASSSSGYVIGAPPPLPPPGAYAPLQQQHQAHQPAYQPQHPIFALTHNSNGGGAGGGYGGAPPATFGYAQQAPLLPQQHQHDSIAPRGYGDSMGAVAASTGYGYRSTSSSSAGAFASSLPRGPSSSGYVPLQQPAGAREPPILLRPAPASASSGGSGGSGASSAILSRSLHAPSSGAAPVSTRVSAAAPGRLLW